MDKKQLIFLLPLISFLLFFIISPISAAHQGKLCPVKFPSYGRCAGMFGISECYDEAIARFGPIPPSGCQCIPKGLNSRICNCNVVCSQIPNFDDNDDDEEGEAVSPSPAPSPTSYYY